MKARTFKLGKKSASFDHRDLLMSRYLSPRELPPIPAEFGHEASIEDWGMLGNDDYGDCVLAGAAHETMLFTAVGDPVTAEFTTEGVLVEYSAITGFDPNDLMTDQGTAVRDAMRYRRHTGIADAQGKRHKIAAYVSLEPGNMEHLKAALYLFGAVGIGIEFPESAMSQFNAGSPWTVVPGARPTSGHYIPLVGWRQNLVCVTWGKLQQITERFYKTYCDEAWAFISEEYLIAGKSPAGFALSDMLADLRNL